MSKNFGRRLKFKSKIRCSPFVLARCLPRPPRAFFESSDQPIVTSTLNNPQNCTRPDPTSYLATLLQVTSAAPQLTCCCSCGSPTRP